MVVGSMLYMSRWSSLGHIRALRGLEASLDLLVRELDKGVVLFAELLRQYFVVLLLDGVLAFAQHALANGVHLVHGEQRQVVVVKNALGREEGRRH